MCSGKGEAEAGTAAGAGVSKAADQHENVLPQVTRNMNALVSCVGAREEHAARGDRQTNEFFLLLRRFQSPAFDFVLRESMRAAARRHEKCDSTRFSLRMRAIRNVLSHTVPHARALINAHTSPLTVHASVSEPTWSRTASQKSCCQ